MREKAVDIRTVDLAALPRFYVEDPQFWPFLAAMIDDKGLPGYNRDLAVVVDARLEQELPYTPSRYTYSAPAELCACVLADKPCVVVLPAPAAGAEVLTVVSQYAPWFPTLVVFGVDAIPAFLGWWPKEGEEPVQEIRRTLAGVGCTDLTPGDQWVRTDRRANVTNTVAGPEGRPVTFTDPISGVFGCYRVAAASRGLFVRVTPSLVAEMIEHIRDRLREGLSGYIGRPNR